MKTSICIILAIFCSLASVRGAEPQFDFSKGGSVKDIETKKKRSVTSYCQATIPLDTQLQNQSFECSYTILFDELWLYKTVIYTRLSDLGVKFSMDFSKRRRTAYFSPMGGCILEKKDGNEFIFVIRYCSFSRSVSYLVKTKAGKTIHEQQWEKLYKEHVFTDFIVTALKSGNKEIGDESKIVVNKDEKSIYAKSVRAKSKKSEISMAGKIYDLKITMMEAGFEDRL
jgi:hypothetical protein